MIKKIDKLVIISFVPPFIATFFISLFVLIMQFLWLYIDDIVGKGVSLWIILKVVFYLSISFFPLALPIAILISSVMVMGNMAEKFELTSLKSSGIPLRRIMMPMLLLALITSIFSFMVSNYFLPVANLKYKSTLWDIRNQKPALSLEAGAFNYDFNGVAIYINDKGGTENSLKKVLIYDHKNDRGRYNATMAKEGVLSMTPDDRYLVLNLEDGQQIQEKQKKNLKSKAANPMIRINFKSWRKVFDLSEFNIDFTDEKLFKSHQSMLSYGQLLDAIDSLELKKLDKSVQFGGFIKNFWDIYSVNDSLNKKTISTNIDGPKPDNPKRKSKKTKTKKNAFKPLVQYIDRPIQEYTSITEIFAHEDYDLISRAKNSARSVHSQAISVLAALEKLEEKTTKRVHEFNNRISVAFMCIVFLFIGAPMGAIIRKGGFGYPLLIAILYFIGYYVLQITFKKLSDQYLIHPAIAAWYPVFILLPIGFFLTYKAMNDSKIIDIDSYTRFFKKLFQKDKATAR